MAHKTMVNSTEYEIKDGVTLVEGVSYSIKNGKVLVGGTEYDISFILPPAALDLWSGTYSVIKCIIYANGYWVVGGHYCDGSAYYARIAYATSLDDTWTTNDLWSGSNYSNIINAIAYADGYFVAVGSKYDGSAYYSCISYASKPGHSWSNSNTVSHTNSTAETNNCIIYDNGYWVAGGSYTYSGTTYVYVKYTTALWNVGWTDTILWNSGSSGNTINTISYGNGYWVAGGLYRSGSNYYARIAYATSPSGTWATKDLWSSSNNSNVINCITYANGYFVAGGEYYDGYIHCARIAYATSPSGTWATKDLWSSTTRAPISCITYADGYWVVGGIYYGTSYYARLGYATSLTGTWTVKNLWSSSSSYNSYNHVGGVVYSNGYWVVGGYYNKSSTYYARIEYSSDFDGFDEI